MIRRIILNKSGYDPGNEILVAQFNNGKLYRYDGVPAETFVSIVTNQESQGKAFTELVKNRSFPFHPIDPSEVQGLQ